MFSLTENNDESHLDGFDFGLWYEATRARPAEVAVLGSLAGRRVRAAGKPVICSKQVRSGQARLTRSTTWVRLRQAGRVFQAGSESLPDCSMLYVP